MTYEFNFSKLTIGDMRPLWSGNPTPLDLIEFVNKVTVGGIMHLPMNQTEDLFEQFNIEFSEWTKTLPKTGDAGEWEEMLNGIKGL